MRRIVVQSYRVARRIVIGTVGATVLAIGVALLVLPGPAFVVIPLGLAILGAEFAWARRWLRKLRAGAVAVKNGLTGGRGGPSAGGGAAAIALVLLPLLFGSGCFDGVSVALPDAGGARRVEIRVSDPGDLGGVRVSLDGSDVTVLFAPGGRGLVGLLPDLPPGPHQLTVSRSFALVGTAYSVGVAVDAPAPAPALAGSEPSAGARAIPRSAWLRFDLASPPSEEALAGWAFAVECDGEPVASERFVDGAHVVVNPKPRLPAGASCRTAWRGAGGDVAELAFQVAPDATGPAAILHYDRWDPFVLAPFPDDYWLVPDASRPSGRRVALETPPYEGLLGAAAQAVANALAERDGWSPVQPIVLAVSHPLDLGNLPRTEAASLDPWAPIGLFDMDPQSPGFGERVGFTLERRSDPSPGGGSEHTLLLYPSRLLRAGGSYALGVTRGLFASGTPGRPLAPSAFLRAVALPPKAGEGPAFGRARESVLPVLAFLAKEPAVPIPLEDVALALRISIRSETHDPADWVSVKEQALEEPPPLLTVTEDAASGTDRLLRGTLTLPLYVTPPSLVEVARDPQTGEPTPVGTDAIPFVFRIPQDAEPPLPIVIYQHGSPGSPEEINSPFNRFLLDAGYALIGIQDVTNRRFGEDIDAQTAAIFFRLLGRGHVPLTEFQTHADLFGLVRAVQAMGAADNFPEIDPTRIFYRGISFGAHHSLGFLPFAPELTAAVSVVGSGRLYESTLHQIDVFDTLGGIQQLLPGAPPTLLIIGLAALQNDADRDDPIFLARHLYREPLAFGDAVDPVPPSLLWIEGIGDSLVSNNGTRSAADELGVPQVRPVVAATSFQAQVDAPLVGNIGIGVTGGHFQYLPSATPSCVAVGQLEGHYCPQIADEAEVQTLHFFASAQGGAAEIIDPFAEGTP